MWRLGESKEMGKCFNYIVISKRKTRNQSTIIIKYTFTYTFNNLL